MWRPCCSCGLMHCLMHEVRVTCESWNADGRTPHGLAFLPRGQEDDKEPTWCYVQWDLSLGKPRTKAGFRPVNPIRALTELSLDLQGWLCRTMVDHARLAPSCLSYGSRLLAPSVSGSCSLLEEQRTLTPQEVREGPSDLWPKYRGDVFALLSIQFFRN